MTVHFDGFAIGDRNASVLLTAIVVILPIVAFVVMGTRGLALFRRHGDGQ